jgi:hypothetical protein
MSDLDTKEEATRLFGLFTAGKVTIAGLQSIVDHADESPNRRAAAQVVIAAIQGPLQAALDAQLEA